MTKRSGLRPYAVPPAFYGNEEPERGCKCMEWLPAEKYYQASRNGRYTVSAAFCSGEWIYTAWRCNTSPGTPLGSRKKAAACKALCEADWKASGAAIADQPDRDAPYQEPDHAQPA